MRRNNAAGDSLPNCTGATRPGRVSDARTGARCRAHSTQRGDQSSSLKLWRPGLMPMASYVCRAARISCPTWVCIHAEEFAGRVTCCSAAMGPSRRSSSSCFRSCTRNVPAKASALSDIEPKNSRVLGTINIHCRVIRRL